MLRIFASRERRRVSVEPPLLRRACGLQQGPEAPLGCLRQNAEYPLGSSILVGRVLVADEWCQSQSRETRGAPDLMS